MQLQLVRTDDGRQLDEIVSAFTPLMRRVCPYLTDADLRAMVERMAMQQLTAEQRRHTRPRRPSRSPRSSRAFPTLQAS